MVLALAIAFLCPAAARSEILTSEGLDQTLAPIALYPDGLLGNVLVAATYPDQVVEADQWLGGNRSVPQDKLESALSSFSWDQSVKALVAAPEALDMMAMDMDWTVRLGTAFVDQTDGLYDAIQRLRARAQGTGALVSNEQVDVVTDDAGYILIGSTNPNYLYVPQYQPAVVYGWTPGKVVLTTATVWGTRAILNNLFYGSIWNWRARSVYFGSGYGSCGYLPRASAPGRGPDRACTGLRNRDNRRAPWAPWSPRRRARATWTPRLPTTAAASGSSRSRAPRRAAEPSATRFMGTWWAASRCWPGRRSMAPAA